MKNKILKLLIIFPVTASLVLSSCAGVSDASALVEDSPALTSSGADTLCLGKTHDMGQGYIDSLIFFGESTTAHIRSRGVLSGGKDTKQVWAPKSGTVNLDSTTAHVKIIYPEDGKELTLRQAAERKKPKIIILTFGLNGAVQKVKQGKSFYKSCYLSLIDQIRLGSPDTNIILQSCFPIAADMDMSNYSINAATLNGYITLINSWTAELAQEQCLGYLDTQSVMRDGEGFLLKEFDAGDGHHLTYEAYMTMLEYIKTHGLKE